MRKPSIYELLIIVVVIIFVSLPSCSNNSTEREASKSKSVSNIDSPAFIRSDTTKFQVGKTLFKSDCGACHVSKGMTDNHLEGIVDRVGINYLKLYLTKQDSLIAVKDKYALKVKDVYGNLGNSHNFKYSNEQLDALIEYLK